jgi:hypothetical protein
VELKEGAVARVRISQKDGIWQILALPIGVPNGDHLIVDSIYDEGRRPDTFQISEAVALKLLPVPECHHLRFHDLISGCRLRVFLALRQPRDEVRARLLTRLRRCEEDFLQQSIAAELRIPDVSGQARLLEVHDVFSTARSGPHKDHPAENGRVVLRDLLRHRPAKREPEHIALSHAQALQESEDLLRHTRHRRRDLASRPSDTRIIEEDDFPTRRERVRDGRVPVVEGPGEVLKEQQRLAWTMAEATIRITSAVDVEESVGAEMLLPELMARLFPFLILSDS